MTTPTNPAAVVEQVDRDAVAEYFEALDLNLPNLAEKARRSGSFLARMFARHRLLGIEQGRAEMREEAAAFLDGYAGGHYMAKSCAQAIRAIPTAKERG